MSYNQRPCVCGGTKFLAIPNVQVYHGFNTDFTKIWMVTMVVCQDCTRTEIFTTNADQVARHYPDARMIEAGGH